MADHLIGLVYSSLTMSLRLKICGLRDADNVAQVWQAAKPDLAGFIFYPPSSRYALAAGETAFEQAWQSVPAERRVLVTVNPSEAELSDWYRRYQPAVIQLHGEETAAYCAHLRAVLATVGGPPRLFKAIGVQGPADVQGLDDYAQSCEALLFDTRTAGYGGSGHAFDWSLLDSYAGRLPFWLSGGIGPQDLARVRALRHPALCGIDINSRFEEAPGQKSVALTAAFAAGLREIGTVGKTAPTENG